MQRGFPECTLITKSLPNSNYIAEIHVRKSTDDPEFLWMTSIEMDSELGAIQYLRFSSDVGVGISRPRKRPGEDLDHSTAHKVQRTT